MTKREAIIQAVVAALAGTTGVGARIFRSRVSALAEKELPALLIEAVSDTADLANIHRYQWNLTFQIFVITATGEVDASADPIIADLHSKIMTDATLQGIVQNLQPASVRWEFMGEKETKPIGVATVQFIATYQTELNSIT